MKRCFSYSCLFLVLASAVISSKASATPPDSVHVTALNNEAGAASLYVLNFALADTLHPADIIEVDFPAGFDISNVKIAGSASINGGFTVDVKQQTVILKRQGLGDAIPRGTAVDLKFSTVVNPQTPQETHQIKVRIAGAQKEAASGMELGGALMISGKKSTK